MSPEPGTGRVLLVGAGPGPADLMTVRAMRAVQGAQALLYDALVSDEVIALAPPGCFRIQTGKRAGRASMAQAAIKDDIATIKSWASTGYSVDLADSLHGRPLFIAAENGNLTLVHN